MRNSRWYWFIGGVFVILFCISSGIFQKDAISANIYSNETFNYTMVHTDIESKPPQDQEISQTLVKTEVIISTILGTDLTTKHEEFLIRSVISLEEEIIMAKCLYGEDRYDHSLIMNKAGVLWCILNRLDSGEWGDSVEEVVTAPHQFSGYKKGNPAPDWAIDLVRDVVLRYKLEKLGHKDVGRVLPEGWLYFACNKGANRFRKTYKSRDYWDWSFPDPYYGVKGTNIIVEK